MFILQCTVLPFQRYTRYIALYSNVYSAVYNFAFPAVDTVYYSVFKCLFCSLQFCLSSSPVFKMFILQYTV